MVEVNVTGFKKVSQPPTKAVECTCPNCDEWCQREGVPASKMTGVLNCLKCGGSITWSDES